jgi:hypothetical protein
VHRGQVDGVPQGVEEPRKIPTVGTWVSASRPSRLRRKGFPGVRPGRRLRGMTTQRGEEGDAPEDRDRVIVAVAAPCGAESLVQERVGDGLETVAESAQRGAIIEVGPGEGEPEWPEFSYPRTPPSVAGLSLHRKGYPVQGGRGVRIVMVRILHDKVTVKQGGCWGKAKTKPFPERFMITEGKRQRERLRPRLFSWTKRLLNTELPRPATMAFPGPCQSHDDSSSRAPVFSGLVTISVVEVAAHAPTTIGSSAVPFPSRML